MRRSVWVNEQASLSPRGCGPLPSCIAGAGPSVSAVITGTAGPVSMAIATACRAGRQGGSRADQAGGRRSLRPETHSETAAVAPAAPASAAGPALAGQRDHGQRAPATQPAPGGTARPGRPQGRPSEQAAHGEIVCPGCCQPRPSRGRQGTCTACRVVPGAADGAGPGTDAR